MSQDLDTTLTPQEMASSTSSVGSNEQLSFSFASMLDELQTYLSVGILPPKDLTNRLDTFYHQRIVSSRDERVPEALRSLDERHSILRAQLKELQGQVREQREAQEEHNLQERVELIQRIESMATDSNRTGTELLHELQQINKEWTSTGAVAEKDRSAIQKRLREALKAFMSNDAITSEDAAPLYAESAQLRSTYIERVLDLAQQDLSMEQMMREALALNNEWEDLIAPLEPKDYPQYQRQFMAPLREIYQRVNQHHQNIKEEQIKNLEAKQQICLQLEEMLIAPPTNEEGWTLTLAEISRLKSAYNKIGLAPRKESSAIAGRYRNVLFELRKLRSAFIKEHPNMAHPDEIDIKIEKMRQLAKEAVDLQHSTSWKTTAERISQMREEWKGVSKIGFRPYEVQELWLQFDTACSIFFQRKDEDYNQRKENVATRRALIQRLESLVNASKDEIKQTVAEVEEAWKQVGAGLPRFKDELNEAYRKALHALKGEERTERHRHHPQRADSSSHGRQTSRSTAATGEDNEAKLKRDMARLNDEAARLEENLEIFRPKGTQHDNPLTLQIEEKIKSLRQSAKKIAEKIAQLKDLPQA